MSAALEPVHDKEKFIREEEQDYDIPLHDGVMQPLAPQTVHITPPDDDYVAPATSPTLDKQLNEFRKECSDITRVAEKVDGNPVKDIKELSDIINTSDFKNFVRKLLHQHLGGKFRDWVDPYLCSNIAAVAAVMA
ncbi:hypothetical protein Tco_0544155 [Tanacetum coccineum]